MQMEQESVFLSIVLLVDHNSELLAKNFQELIQFLANNFKMSELVIVNNQAPAKALQQISDTYQALKINTPKVTVLTLSKIHHQEDAIRAGLDLAIGDFVLEIDNIDFSFATEDLYFLYQKAKSGYDLISLAPQKSLRLSKLFYAIINQHFYHGMFLQTETAILLSRKILNEVSKIQDKTYYRKLMYQVLSHRSTCIHYMPRKIISSKNSLKDKVSAALDIIFGFTDFGFKISVWVLAFFIIMTLSITSYTLFEYFHNPDVIRGWTTLMLFLSFGFTGIFLISAISCKYLSLIFKELRSTPIYQIETINKFEEP